MELPAARAQKAEHRQRGADVGNGTIATFARSHRLAANG